MDRKEIEIGDVLEWAYRQELPKAGGRSGDGGGSRHPLAQFMAYATAIDTTPNRFGCIHDYSAEADPDPDALIVAAAVADLGDLDFSDLAGIDMLGDLPASAVSDEERVKAHEDGARIAFGEDGTLRRCPSIAVPMVAMLGQRLEAGPVGPIKRTWEMLHGKPRWFRIEWREGTAGRSVPIEVDGYNRRSGRPHKDAYRRFAIAPALGPFVAERIDYQAWRLSLDHLASVLEGRLARFAVRPSRAARWPWEGDQGGAGGRVWPCLRKSEIAKSDAA